MVSVLGRVSVVAGVVVVASVLESSVLESVGGAAMVRAVGIGVWLVVVVAVVVAVVVEEGKPMNVKRCDCGRPIGEPMRSAGELAQEEARVRYEKKSRREYEAEIERLRAVHCASEILFANRHYAEGPGIQQWTAEEDLWEALRKALSGEVEPCTHERAVDDMQEMLDGATSERDEARAGERVQADRADANYKEIERLRALIDNAGRPWIALEPGIPWEGAIDSAMEAACEEIERLRGALAETQEIARRAFLEGGE